MDLSNLLLVFFGGSGFVGILTYFLNKQKATVEKETAMIDRLLKEVDRLDNIVGELRVALDHRLEVYNVTQEELFKYKRENTELKILISRLENEIKELKEFIKSMREEDGNGTTK